MTRSEQPDPDDRELGDVGAAIKAHLQRESEVLAEAEGIEGAPGADKITALFAQQRAQAAARRRWPRAAGIAAAAGLLVGLGWFVWGRSRPEPVDPPALLNEGDVVLLAPKGEVRAFDRFSWEPVTQDGLRFVYDLEVWRQGMLEQTLLRVEGLREPSWSPVEALPADWLQIGWTVFARPEGQAAGAQALFGSTRAWR